MRLGARSVLRNAVGRLKGWSAFNFDRYRQTILQKCSASYSRVFYPVLDMNRMLEASRTSSFSCRDPLPSQAPSSGFRVVTSLVSKLLRSSKSFPLPGIVVHTLELLTTRTLRPAPEMLIQPRLAPRSCLSNSSCCSRTTP